MDRIDINNLRDEIKNILSKTFDDMIILNYLPPIAYMDEPYFLIKGNKNGELFFFQYKLVDLWNWKDNGTLHDNLLANRFEA